jgi:hypothetical protein
VPQIEASARKSEKPESKQTSFELLEIPIAVHWLLFPRLEDLESRHYWFVLGQPRLPRRRSRHRSITTHPTTLICCHAAPPELTVVTSASFGSSLRKTFLAVRRAFAGQAIREEIWQSGVHCRWEALHETGQQQTAGSLSPSKEDALSKAHLRYDRLPSRLCLMKGRGCDGRCAVRKTAAAATAVDRRQSAWVWVWQRGDACGRQE